MFFMLLANIIHRIIQIIVLVVIVQVIISYFVDPHMPIRRYLDGFVSPLLAPIKRFVPTVGMLDFSPLILIILLQILDAIVSSILRSLAF